MGAGRTSVVCRRDFECRGREADSDGSMSSSSDRWVQSEKFEELRLSLEVGECTDGLLEACTPAG